MAAIAKTFATKALIARTLCMRVTLVALLVITGACSGIKFAYHQLDWTIPLYVDGYIDLDPDQYSTLELQVEKLLEWHCAAHLHKYAQWMQTIADDVANRRITTAQIEVHQLILDGYFQDIAKQVAPRIVDLLSGISDSQLKDLMSALAEKNDELRTKFIDAPIERVRQERGESMAKRLKTWLGDVENEQQKAITHWVGNTQDGLVHWLNNRERWKKEFESVMKARSSGRAEFSIRLQMLLAHPEQIWSENYRKYSASFRSETQHLLAKIFVTLTQQQRIYLQEKLVDWGNDFATLSCAGDLNEKGDQVLF